MTKMAHNISTVSGRAEMAYVGETPWHGLGAKVDKAMTSGEAITLAGLDWRVLKMPIFFGENHPVKGKFATVRTDSNEALGVVGDKYRVLQNKEAFSFFDAIVGEKLAMFHTAGALGVGERIWMLAKLPGELWVTPKDNIEQYLLLTNSHDGSSAVQIMATPIRVVCQNTLNVAINMRTDQKTRVRHTLNMGTGIEEIRTQLGLVGNYFRIFEELGRHLVSKQANTKVVEELFDALGLSTLKAKESTRTENIRYEILGLFDHGKGNRDPLVKGSAWALFNGVTEYVDFNRSARGKTDGQRLESRAESLLFGSGADIKQRALDSLLTSVR
jgi:phage/plasmid-like protein (TIGR03299 family)